MCAHTHMHTYIFSFVIICLNICESCMWCTCVQICVPDLCALKGQRSTSVIPGEQCSCYFLGSVSDLACSSYTLTG